MLYTLQLYQDPEAGRAHVSSISEFLLAQPCLSFAILDASRRKFARSPESGHDRDVSELTTGKQHSMFTFAGKVSTAALIPEHSLGWLFTML